ncbi:MAG: hypothetical protein IJY98_04980 [Bacteroidaceae bacterium]|nr:hypothetical protein [Bacteroidaceae bacterium]
MKSTFKIILGLLVGAFAFIGCSDSDDTNVAYPSFSLSKNNITIGADAEKVSFVVQAVGQWSIVSAPDWLTVSPANGVGTAVCEVSIQSSTQNDVRSGNIRVRSGAEEYVIAVEQTGFDKVVTPKKNEIEIESFGKEGERYFDIEVVTNIEFKVNVAFEGEASGWLTQNTEEDIDYGKGARPRTLKLRFDWRMNAEPVERTARIQFVPVNADDSDAVTGEVVVNQKPAVKIEDNRAGDSIALITIYELLNGMTELWDTSERMDNWSGVTLWEANDKELPCEEAVGRVRSVSYAFVETEESLPEQIKHLKYLETFSIMSNVNTMLKSIALGSEICELEHLKELSMFSYGLVSLPEEFVKLGNTLEALDLSANNFEDIPEMLNAENFPKLTYLDLGGMRRWTTGNLTNKDKYENGEIGLNLKSDATGPSRLRDLFMWDNLEYIGLSNCYLEGQLPDFEVGKDGVEAYTQDDVDTFGGDTIQWLADNNIPKILPNIKMLRLNLNFFTGELPDWLLYHPYLLEWMPELLVFNQQEDGVDSENNKARFDNAPTDFEYYYSVFPLMRAKYEMKEEIEEEE